MTKARSSQKKPQKVATEHRIPRPIEQIWEFLEKRNKGKYPDPAFLEWIEKSLRTWFENQGKKSLDEIMGLKATKRGESPPFKQAHLAARNNALLKDMAALIAIGFKPHEAAKAVSAKLSASGYIEPIWGTAPSVAWESLMDLYEGWIGREEAEEYFRGQGNSAYFMSFPPSVIPKRFSKGKK